MENNKIIEGIETLAEELGIEKIKLYHRILSMPLDKDKLYTMMDLTLDYIIVNKLPVGKIPPKVIDIITYKGQTKHDKRLREYYNLSSEEDKCKLLSSSSTLTKILFPESANLIESGLYPYFSILYKDNNFIYKVSTSIRSINSKYPDNISPKNSKEIKNIEEKIIKVYKFIKDNFPFVFKYTDYEKTLMSYYAYEEAYPDCLSYSSEVIFNILMEVLKEKINFKFTKKEKKFLYEMINKIKDTERRNIYEEIITSKITKKEIISFEV